MKAEQRFKQNFKALFFFLKTKIHERGRRRVFYIILIIGIFRIDIFLPRKACGGMLLRAVILGSEAFVGSTLKDSSLTLRATEWRASPAFKMRADKISHPITKSEFFC